MELSYKCCYLPSSMFILPLTNMQVTSLLRQHLENSYSHETLLTNRTVVVVSNASIAIILPEINSQLSPCVNFVAYL